MTPIVYFCLYSLQGKKDFLNGSPLPSLKNSRTFLEDKNVHYPGNNILRSRDMQVFSGLMKPWHQGTAARERNLCEKSLFETPELAPADFDALSIAVFADLRLGNAIAFSDGECLGARDDLFNPLSPERLFDLVFVHGNTM
jgi:hypothetical protein